MAKAVYTQNTIAMVWDFDCTLIPGYSQTPLFKRYGVEAQKFWDEVNALPDLYAERGLTVGEDTGYLLHILTYVREGIFGGLTNAILQELGGEIPMCPGIPDFLAAAQAYVASEERFRQHEITIEHYIVSTGIKPLIEGSIVGPLATRIWANEFVDQLPPAGYLESGYKFGEPAEIAGVGYTIDNTSKTRAIFEINKGDRVHVNSRVAEDERRVPFQNIIYTADGPSDIPVFSMLQKNGGRTLGVYRPGNDKSFRGVKQLQDDGRVNCIAPADYQPETQAHMWLMETIREIATRICDERERYFNAIKEPPGHVA